MSNYGSFWQEVVSGGGPAPTPTLTIAWDADQVSGENGRFTVEMPTGTVGNATGLWTDSDASAAEPVDEIYFTLDRETFELGTALTGAAETTVQVGRTPGPNVPPRGTLRITDDAGAYRELPYSSFTGSAFTLASAADFSVTGASVNNAVGVLGRRIEVTSNSSFETTAGTWGLAHSDFALIDDAQPMISYITDFNGNQASASVLFLLDHQDPLQALDVPAPTRHPNFRDASSGLDWDFTTAYSTPIPDWEWDDEATQYQLTTTGYGGHVKVPASFLAPTMRLVVSANSEYAGKACEPRFSVAVPEDKTIWFEVTHVRGVTVTTNSYSWAGPIDWTGNPSELNITLPKVELEANDRLDIRVWATGSGTLDPLWQYSDHRVVEQGPDVPFTDPMGMRIDPNAVAGTGVFGDLTKPFSSGIELATNAFWDSLPTTNNPGEYISVYADRGTVINDNSASAIDGDYIYLKGRRVRLLATPGTSGQAPTIDGLDSHPIVSGAVQKAGTRADVALLNIYNCPEAIVDGWIIRGSSQVGIRAAVDPLVRAYNGGSLGSVCDSVTIQNCIIKDTGGDGVIFGGDKGSSGNGVYAEFPVTNFKLLNTKVINANSGYQSLSDNNIVGGQAVTIVHADGGLVQNVDVIGNQKEGFDVISSKNIDMLDLYLSQDPTTVYGDGRGPAFYTDTSDEGCENIRWDRLRCDSGAVGISLAQEAGGDNINVTYSNVELTGLRGPGISIPDIQVGSTVGSYSGCVIEHVSVAAASGQFPLRITVADATGITIRNCIFKGDVSALASKTIDADWPTMDKNWFFRTGAAYTGHTGTNAVVDVDPQFVSDSDLDLQPGSTAIAQITPSTRTQNVLGYETTDPDNYGAF